MVIHLPLSMRQVPDTLAVFDTAFCHILLLICLFLNPFFSNAQNKRSELEQRRQKLLQQIDSKNKELGETKKEKSLALDRLEMLHDQIETRESLINTLHDELDESDKIIERTEGVIEALSDDQQKLRVEYAALLRRAYKMKMPSNSFVYLLSAKNFEESYKRWQYFRQYDKFRKRQVQLIAATQKSLEQKNQALIQQKQQKGQLLTTNEQQKRLLTAEKSEKDKLVQELKDEESRLKSELKSAEKQSAKLNAAIENLIAAEIEARRREAEARIRKAKAEAEKLAAERKKEDARRAKKESAASNTLSPNAHRAYRDETQGSNTEGGQKPEVLTESPQNLALSSDFRANKGRLPNPATGLIVRHFGKQKVLDKVTAVNNGIDIRTAEGAEVRAVFNGTVSVVSGISGLGTVVLIQHGNYYTVYSNLASVTVKKGDVVTARQNIGKAAINSVTNDPEVHFEIWLERTQLNPSVWLSK
jgi:septal ring factor EnvC (AmiA/AmiB activator)